MADPEQETAVWCRTEPNVFGTYMLVIAYDDDNVLTLNADELSAYVTTVTQALARAVYAEAIREQLRAMLMRNGRNTARAEQVVIETVADLRSEWPELRKFAPYEIRDCVSFEGRTSVQIWRGGQVIQQFAPHNVREHVAQALTVYAAADLDNAYRRYLVGAIGATDERARAAVAQLAEHIREV